MPNWLSPKRRTKCVKNLISEWNQKQQHFFPHAFRSFLCILCIRFVAVALQSEEEVCQRQVPSMPYFGPALDPPLGGSGRKTTLVGDHEYLIPTKFHQNPSGGSGEEVENVKSLWWRRQRTDDGRCTMTIAHWSLWLLCANKKRWILTSLSRRQMQQSQFITVPM